ncbi:MAG: hypothetical protein CME68_06615 [Halobacteriovoraceae bacterium]|nr:hypothetical protein [Halobacteriovoraceae bacterium]
MSHFLRTFCISTLFFSFFNLIANKSLADNKLEFEWDYENHPQNMVERYTTVFNELPLEGEIQNQPWSGDYWPTQKGGISYRWYVRKASPHDGVKRFGYDFLNMKKYEKDIKKKKHLVSRKTKLEFIREFGPREGIKKFNEYIKTAPEIVIDPAELSPSEKYDLFMGDKNWSLTRRERERTEISELIKALKKDPKTDRESFIPSWWGLCHAWAPATILYKNPNPIGYSDPFSRDPAPIKLKNPSGIEVPFGSADIKALLTVHLDIAESIPGTTTFLGSRCNLELEHHFQSYNRGEISEIELNSLLEREGCNDTNAGSFHVTLTNLIGHYKTGFVMDHDRGSEVWNQGIVSYKVLEHIEKPVPEKFKKNVSKILSIKNEVTWISEINQSWKKVTLAGRNGFQKSVYNYDLYLNKNDEIIGGAWLNQTNLSDKKWKDRPDFLWMRPKINFSKSIPALRKIYSTAIGEKENFKAKKMWKKAYKKIKLSKKFIKTTKDFAKVKKEEKKKYLYSLGIKSIDAFKRKVELSKKIKKNIKVNFGNLISRVRRNIFKRERAVIKRRSHLEEKNGKVICHILYHTSEQDQYQDFNAEGKNIQTSCDKALKKCENYKFSNKIKNAKEYCLKGKSKDYLYTCTYTLFANPDPVSWLVKKIKTGRKMGVFTHKALVEDVACLKPKRKCEKRRFWKRACKKEVKQPLIRL